MVGFLTHGRGSHRRKQRVACLAFPAGAKLFDSEHPSRRIYLLHSGRLQLSSDREVILDHLKRGDLFGEKHFVEVAPGAPSREDSLASESSRPP